MTKAVNLNQQSRSSFPKKHLHIQSPNDLLTITLFGFGDFGDVLCWTRLNVTKMLAE